MRKYGLIVALLLVLSQGAYAREVLVAGGGGLALTPEDLRLEVYKMGPSYKFSDTYEERRKLVDVIATRFYLTEEAFRRGFGEEGLAEELRAAEEVALADAYRGWKVEKAVRVPRVASRSVLQNLGRELHVKEMTFAVYAVAEEALRDLGAGKQFADLEADVRGREDIRVIDHGWKLWRNFDRSVAYDVFALSLDGVTDIVKVKTGYSIFHLVEAKPWGENPELIYLRSKRFVRAQKEADLKRKEIAELSKVYKVRYSDAGVAGALRAFAIAFAAGRPPDSLLALDLLSYSGGSMNVARLLTYYFALPVASQPYAGDAHGVREFALEVILPGLEALAARDMGLARLPEVIWSAKKAREEFLIPKMEEFFRDQVTLGPNDRMDYYNAHKDEMVTPRTYRARRILLDSEEGAREAMKELRSGKDFAELARERSLDQYTAPKGGDLGTLQFGVIATYDSALADLQPGDVTRPFETSSGTEILKLEERGESRAISFDEASAFLDGMILDSRTNELLARWVDGRKKEAGYAVDESLLRRVSLPEPAWRKSVAKESRMEGGEG